MRRVMLKKFDKSAGKFGAYVDDVAATFHQFGATYQEFESGPGNYTVGIIELADGTVQEFALNMFRFLEPIGAGKA